MEQNNNSGNFLSGLSQFATAAPVTEAPAPVQAVPTPSPEEPGLLSRAGDFLSRAVSGGPFTMEAFTDLAKEGAAPVKSEVVDAKSIAEDTKASPELRLKATEAVLQQEQDAADLEAAKRSQAAQKYLNALKTSEELNTRLKKMYGENTDKLVKLPDPEKFGVSAADVAAYQSQISGEKQLGGDSPTQIQTEEQIRDQAQRKQLEEMQRQQMLMVEQDLARQNASLAAQMNYSDKMRQLMDEKIASIDSEQQEIDKIDPNRFWNSRSTPQKILGALAIAAGELGRSMSQGKTNIALDIINEAIKNDIDAQQMTQQQKLIMRQNALRRVDAEINKFAQLSQDQLRKTELQKIQSGLRQQQMALKQQQAQSMLRRSLTSGEGIPPQMVDVVAGDETTKNRLVPLPNGNFAIAVGEKQAELARKNLDKLEPGLKSLKDIQNFYKNFNKLSITDQSRLASELAVNFSAVKQAMNEVGALTENDVKRIEKALGNPSILPTVLAEVKVQSLINNAEGKRDVVYKQAGITVPETERQRYRRLMRQKNKSLSDEAIEAQLDKAGYK